MKIVSIVSSARKEGNTERITKLMELELKKTAEKNNIKAEFEHISLGNLNIKFCRGCRVCFDKGEVLCPLKDEILNVRDKIMEADGIILASPVYVEDVNGIMKNWIDRMAFNNHRPAFAGKSAVILTTSGIGSSNHALKTMKSALTAWGFSISAEGKFRAGGLMDTEKIQFRHGSKISFIADKLFNDVYNGKAMNPSFISLLYFKVQQKYWQKSTGRNGTLDYAYWKDKGWTDKDCSYYIPNKAGLIKTGLAGMAGNIVSRFFV